MSALSPVQQAACRTLGMRPYRVTATCSCGCQFVLADRKFRGETVHVVCPACEKPFRLSWLNAWPPL